VRTLRVVELEGAGERFENGLGGAAQIAALEPRVVVDRDASEQRGLLAAQPRNAPGPLPKVGSPACSGVILARREVRNSLISLFASMAGR